ncbi:PREDICTED: transmembrane protein 198-like isoform X1 [Condylura cristata]|uniref:transmembrane protein 198-like isoform X1 n=2 Tax=Condylura cristata TaxID=143302 RepID=UPI00064345AF|nr:PREDICTED: transmembrane protein 198-like isoform X1 [Condylura cristata]
MSTPALCRVPRASWTDERSDTDSPLTAFSSAMEEVLLPLALTSDPRLFNQQLPEAPDPRCVLEPQDDPQLTPALVCALCCCFGIIYCCFGYRCFKAVMFLSGLLSGALVIFLLCHKERVLETQLSLEVSAGIALGIGLLCGLVTMLVRSVGLFLTGLLLGLTLGAGALLGSEPVYQPPSAWVPAGGLVGLALLGALLTLRWPRPFTVLGTALLGAAVLVACADYFLEGLALGSRLGQRLQALPASPPLCWYSWVLLGTWPALGALGALAQWKLMDEEHGGHANAVLLSRQRRHLQLLRIRQQQAKWHRTSSGVGLCEGSYQGYPSAPRSPADSLAPSYLQSLQERQRGPGPQATAPHTILDLDSDCGSTVPLTRPSVSPQT